VTGASGETIRLTVERRIAASAEAVFDAWLDPDAVGRWLFATPGGVMEQVELDPRVGGRFIIAERRGGELAEHFGEYVEIDRPRRLVFTFATSLEEMPSRVTVTLQRDGEGTRLTLVHEMLAKWADHADRTRHGWTTILDGLAAELEKGKRA
jgi:uncharacterized protein YndB with AHSA1/START domain